LSESIETPGDPELPLVSGEIPGTGGSIKVTPEDFTVEEIPAYQPEGEGEHLFVHLTKRGITTEEVQKALARAFGVNLRDVGSAGIKDKHAVASQYFSVLLKNQTDPQRVYDLEKQLPVTIHSTRPHRNKLKRGHLQGNIFTVRVTDLPVRPGEAAARARRTAEKLRQIGLPNYYGPQRFGMHGDNAGQGREILQGTRRVRKKSLRSFLLSAYQSHLFNSYLVRRITDGLYHTMLCGDIARKLETGGIFVVDNAEAAQERLDVGEISYTGPIFGKKMKVPQAAAAQLEDAVLAEQGIERELFAAAGLSGSRRQGILIPEIDVQPEAAALHLLFTLPSGAYATVLLREVVHGGSQQG
jgi:tRNA pseudouridine13 synthase